MINNQESDEDLTDRLNLDTRQAGWPCGCCQWLLWMLYAPACQAGLQGDTSPCREGPAGLAEHTAVVCTQSTNSWLVGDQLALASPSPRQFICQLV